MKKFCYNLILFSLSNLFVALKFNGIRLLTRYKFWQEIFNDDFEKDGDTKLDKIRGGFYDYWSVFILILILLAIFFISSN